MFTIKYLTLTFLRSAKVHSWPTMQYLFTSKSKHYVYGQIFSTSNNLKCSQRQTFVRMCVGVWNIEYWLVSLGKNNVFVVVIFSCIFILTQYVVWAEKFNKINLKYYCTKRGKVWIKLVIVWTHANNCNCFQSWSDT